MTRAFHVSRVNQRRVAWLVAFVLLWQQVAVAAYACQLPAQAVATVTEVLSSSLPARPDDSCAGMPDVPPSPLCKHHCAPDHATQVTVQTTSVPLSALTAVPPMLVSVAVAALQSDRVLASSDHWRAPPPVPRLLFCSLLI
ncbi:MAG: hypothetical protein ABIQ63_11385 [Rhodanobacter sp.]